MPWDFVFQRIFGRQENKEILISFLNAILMLENDSIGNKFDRKIYRPIKE
ncbi:PD-(D/E)XK nuclease family transposase [Pseudobacteroides cellulosolvens]|nr:PD-(D/E)XK nuclease family transposase [Pseudobacteroides cellulosolvens]